MTAEEILAVHLGGQETIRAYLRGVEEDSETDLDARRSMLAAISYVRAAGVYDVMARLNPELYAQAALLLCRAWTDAEDSAAASIAVQAERVIYQLRYDEQNVKE